MANLEKSTLVFVLLMQFQVILSVEVISTELMEKIMEGIEDVLQNHSQKIDRLENQMTKIVDKLGLTESKNHDILRELGKLEPKVSPTEKAESRISSSKIWEGVAMKKSPLPTKQPSLKYTQATFKPEGSKNDQVPSKENHPIKLRTPTRKNRYYFNEIVVTNFPRKNEQNEFHDFRFIKTTPPTLKSMAQQTSTTNEFNRKIRLDHTDGRSYLFKNQNSKCLAVGTKGDKLPSENGAKIIQSDCNPLEKGQMWKWEGKNLCNDWGKCLSAPNKTPTGQYNLFQWDFNGTEKHQKWVGLKRIGLLINMDSCLAINDNSDANGAEAITNACNEKENGQVWSFFWN